MQLCYEISSQPQADDMVDVTAILSRWHLRVLHNGRSDLGALRPRLRAAITACTVALITVHRRVQLGDMHAGVQCNHCRSL